MRIERHRDRRVFADERRELDHTHDTEAIEHALIVCVIYEMRLLQFAHVLVNHLVIRLLELRTLAGANRFDDRRRQTSLDCVRLMREPFVLAVPKPCRNQNCKLAQTRRQARTIAQQQPNLLPFLEQLRMMQRQMIRRANPVVVAARFNEIVHALVLTSQTFRL